MKAEDHQPEPYICVNPKLIILFSKSVIVKMSNTLLGNNIVSLKKKRLKMM